MRSTWTRNFGCASRNECVRRRSQHQEGGGQKKLERNEAQGPSRALRPERPGVAACPDHLRLELVGGGEQAGERRSGAFGGGAEGDEVCFELIDGARLEHGGNLDGSGKRLVAVAGRVAPARRAGIRSCPTTC